MNPFDKLRASSSDKLRTELRGKCSLLIADCSLFNRGSTESRPTGRSLRWLLSFVLVLLSATLLMAQDDPRWTNKPSDESRFTTLKVFVESGSQPLAAYQVIVTLAGSDRIVGIEGGGVAPFRQPPSYDPQAIDNDRVILAAFSTEPAERLPKGKVLVATIHAKVRKERAPRVQVKMQTAAGTDGEPIQAQVEVVEGTAK